MQNVTLVRSHGVGDLLARGLAPASREAANDLRGPLKSGDSFRLWEFEMESAICFVPVVTQLIQVEASS